MFALHLQLMNKRYLIVFDDVWNIDEWYEGLMSSGLPDEGLWAGHLRLDRVLPKDCGGSVIVTSRLEEVAVKMVGEENMCRIEPDKDGECCWNIFTDSVTEGGLADDHPTLRSTKTEIVDRCGGLPLAAKTIGEILRGSLSPASREFGAREQASSLRSL
ncbi:NB-ARC domain [Musa troglodytarum]|uniref:NB-ARC domain n=1 Tax=Musa troglodytarum TaxID=320322 RepID=A0A9E7JCT5_9LILI|nr:NB-ARC domain [Musa troglodytarum]